MPLPFIAGLAIGSTVALLFTKRKTLKKVLETKSIQQSIHQGKELSLKAYNKLLKNFKDTNSHKDSNGTKKNPTKNHERTTKKG